MQVGDKVRAIKMPDDSFYKQVEGKIRSIENGYVTIDATRVKSKWSTEWEDHPTLCTTSTKVEDVELLVQNTIIAVKRR